LNWRIYQGDAVEMSGLPAESIDLIVTDPAYESLEKWRKLGTTTRLKQSKMSSNEWFQIFPNSRFHELFAAMYRVLRRDRHAYVFCDDETSDIVKIEATMAGFKVWKRLVFDKICIGLGYHYRAQYEFIVFMEKGKRKLNNLGQSDIIRAKRVVNGYPIEKPSEVAAVLISNSTRAGERVLDPFSGSASTGEAAITSGRKFIGFDLSEKAVEVGRARLEALEVGRGI
jgi:site-specific DNA-methyltransferase (adenine-specific)